MSNQQDFRRYAEQCEYMARATDVAEHYRDALEMMARTWLRLAMEEEKIADLVRAADTLLTPLGALKSRLGRPAMRSSRSN